MALGSNIEYKIKTLFETAFDEKSAKQVEKFYKELAKRSAESSKEEFAQAFQQFGMILNNALNQLKLQPIDVGKLIQLPQAEAFAKLGAEFVARFSEGFGGAVSAGGGAQEQLAQLQNQKAQLEQQYQKRKNQVEKYRTLAENVAYVEPEDAHAFSLKEVEKMSGGKTADQFAMHLSESYNSLLDDLYNLEKGTEQYNQTLIKTYEAAHALYRMRATMDKHPGLVTNEDVRFDYDDESLQANVQEQLVEQHGASFSEFTSRLNQETQAIAVKLNQVNQQINNIKQNSPDIINKEANTAGLKTLNEIEAAYKRIWNQKTNKLNVSGKHLESTLMFDPSQSKEGLQSLYKQYNSLPEGANWEDEYQALLKYVKLYEYYRDSENKTWSKKTQQPEYLELYNQLKPMAANAESMLHNVYNMANNVPLIGMGGEDPPITKQDLVDMHDAADAAERLAAAEREAAEEARKKRIEQEKAAQAAKAAAEAAERERAAQENLNNVENQNQPAKDESGVHNTNADAINNEARAQERLNSVESQNTHSAKTNRDNIQTILGDMNSFLSSNKDAKIRDYFVSITTGAHKMSNDVRSAIEATIGSIDTLHSIDIGANNYGGLVGDKSALILRKPGTSITEKYNNAIELQNRLGNTNISDVSLGKIQEVINAEKYLVELQNRVSGAPISTIGEAIEGINPDVLNTTEANVRSLIQAMRELYNVGVEVDVQNLGNILYDGQSGKFGIVDMDVKKDGNPYGFESFEEEAGAFAQTVRDQIADIADPRVAQEWSRFADTVDAEVGRVAKENVNAINAEAQAQDKLNSAETKNPKTDESIKQEAIAYDDLRKKVEAYIKVRQQMLSLMDQGQPWQHLMPDVNAAKASITSLFPETGDSGTTTASMVGNMLNNKVINDDHIKQLANDLGIEIPQAAQKAADAIDNVNKKMQEGSPITVGGAEKIAGQTIDIPNDRGAELTGQLDGFGADATDIGGLEANLAKRKEIFALLQQENLLTDEIKAKYDAGNKEIQEKIDLLKQAQTPVDTSGSQTVTGGGTGADTGVVPGGTDGAATGGEVANLEAIRSKVTEVTTAVNAKTKAFTDEDAEVTRVTGSESAALTTLKGNIEAVTTAVGSTTHAFTTSEGEVNRVISSESTALDALMQKILNVQSALAGMQSNNAGAAASQKMFKVPKGILQNVLGRFGHSGVDTQQSGAVSGDGVGTAITSVGTGEVSNLETLRAKLAEVTTAVNLKTQAFTGEEAEVTRVVGAENTALTTLKGTIDAITAAVGLKTQAFVNGEASVQNAIASENAALDSLMQKATSVKSTLEGLLSNIQTGQSNIGAGLSNVTVTVNGGTDVEQQGVWALDTTAQAIKSTLDGIRSAIGSVVSAIKTSNSGGNNATPVDNGNQSGTPTDTNPPSGGGRKKKQATTDEAEQANEKKHVDYLMDSYKKLGQERAKLTSISGDSKEGQAHKANIEFLEAEIEKTRALISVNDELEDKFQSAYGKSVRDTIISENTKLGKKADREAAKQDIEGKVRKSHVTKAEGAATKAKDVSNAFQSLSLTDDNAIEMRINKVMQLDEATERLNQTTKKVQALGGDASKEDINELIQQRQNVESLSQEMNNLMANYERFSGPNSEVIGQNMLGTMAKSGDYQKQLTEAVQLYHKGKASIKGYNAETNELTYTLKTGTNEFTTFTAGINQTEKTLVSVRGATTNTMGVFESIGKKVKEYSYYFTGSMMIYRLFAQVKQGITYVKEIDAALTELKKVTDETEESYSNFLKTASKTASEVGSTIQEVVNSTADFARLGYAMKEAAEMAKNAQILMNVSEFEDISTATDTLISAIQAFDYSADESLHVVDIMNVIGNNYAISTSDLAESLTRSSAALVAAGGTLEEAAALTAAANTIAQDPESVGKKYCRR